MFLEFYLLGLFILLCFADSESDDSADDFELLEGIANFAFACFRLLKFIYSKKATKFCEISTNYLSYVLPVK